VSENNVTLVTGCLTCWSISKKKT